MIVNLDGNVAIEDGDCGIVDYDGEWEVQATRYKTATHVIFVVPIERWLQASIVDDEPEETWDEEFDRRHAEAVEIFMGYYGYPPDDEDHSDLEVVEDILSHIPVQDIETHNQSMSMASDSTFRQFETRQQYRRWYEAEDY